jgi:bacterioferritin-associated ferredoxin
MMICHCNGVSDRTVRNAVLAGADTLDQVARACGAGRDCGGCVDAIEEILEVHAVPVLLKSAS